MKNLLIGLLALTSLSAFAGDCIIKTYTRNCDLSTSSPCLRPVFQKAADKVEVKGLDLLACVQVATQKKLDFASDTSTKRVFDRVEIKFQGDEGSLKANLKD